MIRVARRLPEIQFVRFCAVGASGYAVNLAVYAALLAAGTTGGGAGGSSLAATEIRERG